MTKEKIDIITLGCSKNLVDSEFVIKQFEAIGFTVHHDPEIPKAPIAIINTCGFIGDAKEESIDTILQFAQRKKQGKLKKLLVMGCLSERYRNELSKEIPEVDKFYGKFEYKQVVLDLSNEYNEALRLQRTVTTPKHYTYVKISEGCNRLCSYCAIPIITGRHISRPEEDILEEVKMLAQKGTKEFQIIAQDLSYYGIDLYKKSKLADLINKISDINGVEWIRLHYAYPAGFPLDILPVMRERENVCKYLDIAFQHISDNMLKKMRRNVTKAQTYELIDRIRTEVPGIHLRTTLMVGHPGETEQDFEELKDFTRKIRFERMGAFTYSDEDGTYANLHYKDDITPDVKQQRLDVLMDLQQNISKEHNEKKKGKTFKVIIDREEADSYIGRTEYDSPEVDQEVLINKDRRLEIGQFYDVNIENAEDFDLFGKVI
ncbi:MAG: 30S ribosomal protein S12 methylthiotransferase RimO [Bacteroidales bacterium]|nr:30S ribosomal protein S12 methylthiotransferase RimO [Bacteroidales bacterium]